MSLNRAIAPNSAEIKNFNIIEAQKIPLDSGLDLYYVNAGNEDVVRVDFVFNAGSRNQNQKCLASYTAQMLSEGTKRFSAKQLADRLDYFGAYFSAHSSADDATVTLYCISKHLDSCLPFIVDVLSDSTFPEEELKIIKNNNIQRLLVNEQRNSFLLRRHFYNTLFGGNSTYGSFATQNDIEKIDRVGLVDFYNKNYFGALRFVLVSGRVSDSVISTISKYAKTPRLSNNTVDKSQVFSESIEPQKSFIKKPGSVQSGIRIGRKMFNRTHKDYRELQLLNLVLGGYFGSRLMKKIREESGLTYGIYSALESFREDGCWYIETEINHDLRERGLTEIYNEIKKLREIKISENELNTCKNYMLGSFLRSIDGPFSLADRFKTLHDFGFDYNYYYTFVETIKSARSERLQELANLYFSEKDLSEIIVG